MTTSNTIELPRYVLALFEGDGGEAATTDAGAAGGTATAVAPVAPAAAVASRDQAGRFASQADAERRVNELTESDKARRLENKELKTTLAATQRTIDLSNQRAIRAEARVALQSEGVLDTDVVDLFLKWAGDKVKVDDKTGDIVGIEHVKDYKAAKPSLFKAATEAAAAAADGAAATGAATGTNAGAGAGTAAGATDAGKANATAGGASTAGAGGSQGATNAGGLPDLRKLSPEERKAALKDYKRSQRSTRGR